MVMNEFIDQMIDKIVKSYQDKNILLVNVPRKMTLYYQPLDLNGYYKWFLKQKFSKCYSAQVGKQLANKVELENVEVKLRLSTLKSLQIINYKIL